MRQEIFSMLIDRKCWSGRMVNEGLYNIIPHIAIKTVLVKLPYSYADSFLLCLVMKTSNYKRKKTN